MLHLIRKIAAICSGVLITLLLLDVTGALHAWLGWLAKIQFLPALLAHHFIIVVALLLLTLVLGRVYCSIICPLGIYQDAVAWVAGKFKKNRYSYSPNVAWLRYSTLGVFVVAMVLGISVITTLLAPYSAYGRIVASLVAPLYRLGNNLLAGMAERMDSYAFYEVEVWIKSLPTLIVAVVTLVAVTVLAWRGGRTYCNTVCPVGTLLGFFAKYALFKPIFDSEKCNKCGLCARNCKASCIDHKSQTIDYSRCVDCMVCLDKCKKGAMHYRFVSPFAPKKVAPAKAAPAADTDSGRRNFIATTTLLTVGSALKAQEMKLDGGLATIEKRVVPQRNNPILPPGALSVRHFAKHCTACQLCVSACPNDVLRPSSSLSNFMQPHSSYERGYCRPECTACGDVCPTGAIQPITKEEKSALQVGHAVWVKKNCVVITDGVECGNCARHCPTGAITMVEHECKGEGKGKGKGKGKGEKMKGKRIPVINTELCIGCGACENLCPARPFGAIFVEGNTQQREI